jgi:hypothetical protein
MQAIPRITTDFNALPDVGWYIGAYNLAAYVLSQPTTAQRQEANMSQVQPYSLYPGNCTPTSATKCSPITT